MCVFIFFITSQYWQPCWGLVFELSTWGRYIITTSIKPCHAAPPSPPILSTPLSLLDRCCQQSMSVGGSVHQSVTVSCCISADQGLSPWMLLSQKSPKEGNVSWHLTKCGVQRNMFSINRLQLIIGNWQTLWEMQAKSKDAFKVVLLITSSRQLFVDSSGNSLWRRPLLCELPTRSNYIWMRGRMSLTQSHGIQAPTQCFIVYFTLIWTIIY